MPHDETPADDEPFFARWSRKKQTTKRATETPAPVAPQPVVAKASPTTEPAAGAPVPATDAQPAAETQPAVAPKPLTEDDFADVDFNALTYQSDYGRFTQAGVPESIRQKALTKLWHSDTMFTQVDPFQDYAGDYTDAAVVPASGIVKTAYKIGQGFLSDDEAHAWDRLGKPAVAAEIDQWPVLRPGFRVRSATDADADALVAVQIAAIGAIGAEAYGTEVADSWAVGLQAEPFRDALQAGEHLEVAIHEDTGAIVAFCGSLGSEIKALFVAPHFGRRALATRLLARAEAHLKARSVQHATVLATVSARALYDRQGYVLRATRAHTTRGGREMEVFEMSKHLIRAENVEIAQETPDQPEIRAFFAASEAYMAALYPAESNHFVDAATLAKNNVVFLVARSDGFAIGCGAIVKQSDGTAEIKRMWLAPAARGLKLGARILAALEAAARADGVHCLQLETGNAQPEALGLYRRAGFSEIAAFGQYAPDPLSVFMAKGLTTTGPTV
jgi:putative acetyltransferase